MADSSIPIISLSSGVGMLDQAVELVLPQARVACFVEWESGAASTLLARMADQAMEPAPIWCGDMGGLDARFLRDVVDILLAGLPCQPYSTAGKREGTRDARSFGAEGAGPLPQALRIIDECRPALVFFENVPAFVRGLRTPDGQQCYPFRDFGSELSRLGYEILVPIFLAAGDVRASHERERVFVMAYDVRQRCKITRILGLLDGFWKAFGDHLNGCDSELADAERQPISPEQREEPGQWQDLGAEHQPVPGEESADLADATSSGRDENGNVRPWESESRGSGRNMGHTSCDYLRDDRQPQIERCKSKAGRSGRKVADPGCRRDHAEQSLRIGGGSGSASTCEASPSLGITHRQPEQQPHHPAGAIPRGNPRGSAGGASGGLHGEMADSSRSGREGGESPLGRIGPAALGPIAELCPLPVFAPGPGSPDWGDIIADRPDLAPAIEPGLRVLVDGVAYVVDAARADQLRCVGNGVVALQAALAFALLLRRLGRRTIA